LVVEIVPIEGISEVNNEISYLGVILERARFADKQFLPDINKYLDYVNDREITLPLQRDIAVAFSNGDPILLEGGTSLSKTTTIKKMAAELGWEVHYANLNESTDVGDLMGKFVYNSKKTGTNDTDVIFADGTVTRGLRQEEGKIKIIILDEFNAASPGTLVRLHEILDALERNGEVTLQEEGSQIVAVNKSKTKIIALTNPPGKGFLGKKPLDPAQLRRWIYKKLPTELPESTFNLATDALFRGEYESQGATADMFIKSRREHLTVEQLKEIPGFDEIVSKYKEFHKAAKELVKNRKIGADQPQPFTYDDRMEPRRVRDFILRFYQGDINETFQKALRYYYLNKLESDTDRKKLNEILRNVMYKATATASARRSL